MSLFNRIIVKIKSFLERQNTIGENVNITKQSFVSGSVLLGNIKIEDNSRITQSNLKGNVIVGNSSTIAKSKIHGFVEIGQRNRFNEVSLSGDIKIGDNTSLWGPNLDINSTKNAKVTIGNFCSIARNVTFQSYNHNFKKATSYFIGQNVFNEKWENEKVAKGDIILQNDVWIGTHCVILGGITIENGAVVAANSVVTKDIPAFAIVAGSPAKIIGFRFEPQTIIKLQEIAWWNWSLEKIKQNKPFFENELTETSINKIINE